jgi:formylglycine-generating enzyme required for sulfatase activity
MTMKRLWMLLTLAPLACGSTTEAGAEAVFDATPPALLGCPDGMAYLPAGTFRLGCPGTEDMTHGALPGSHCDRDEGPAHDVTLTAFCIDRTEVTTAAYAACIADAGTCSEPNDVTRHVKCNWEAGKPRVGREAYPVNCLNWVAADTYCRWRTGCTAPGCALPTEAQWEWAARGPGETLRTYPWGETPPDCTFANFGEYAQVVGAGWCVGETVAVCSTPTGNTPGTALCDLGGNVWEYTRDYYSETFYGEPAATGLNPVNTTKGPEYQEWDNLPPSSRRAVRGGSWYDDYMEDYLRGTKRDYFGELDLASSLGFRCVAEPIEVVTPAE